jgi:plastocyanin
MKRLMFLAVACISAAAIAAGCSGGGGGTGTTASNASTGGSTGGGGTGGSTGGSTGGGGTGGSTGGSGTPPSVQIMVINNSAAPMGFSFQSPVTATSGQSIAWVDQSTAEHGITWNGQTPSSSPSPGANIPIFQPGTTSNTFTAPTVTVATVYHYYCTVHGPTMAGVINVNPAGAATTGGSTSGSTTSGSTTSGSTTSGSTTSGSTTSGPVY